MTAATQRLLAEALQLPDDERETLGWALLDTVLDAEQPDAVEAAWRDEARRRLAELRATGAGAKPWGEVEAKLRALVRTR